MNPIRLFWWRKENGMLNLGDEIGRDICEFVSGRSVVRADLHTCDMLSAGSTLSWVFSPENLSMRKNPCFVWGSGLMVPQAIGRQDKVVISSVRGYMTRCLVESKVEIFVGDPGILASEIWPASKSKSYSIGLIPHWSQIENSAVLRFVENRPHTLLIDIRTSDSRTFMQKLSSCERILSSSLHGLVFADSYGIPNAWLDNGDVHTGSGWKFYDYFSSVSRDSYDGVNTLTNTCIDTDEVYSIPSAKRIASLKRQVFGSFPHHLKAGVG